MCVCVFVTIVIMHLITATAVETVVCIVLINIIGHMFVYYVHLCGPRVCISPVCCLSAPSSPLISVQCYGRILSCVLHKRTWDAASPGKKWTEQCAETTKDGKLSFFFFFYNIFRFLHYLNKIKISTTLSHNPASLYSTNCWNVYWGG